MLSWCQSTVKCKSINIEDSCRHKVNYCYHWNFPGLEFM
jgi:hypothetical protein